MPDYGSVQCQQNELYGAEAQVPKGRPITAGELQSFVDGLRDSLWWEQNFDMVLRIEAGVRSTSNDGSVGGWSPASNAGAIEMAPAHLNELVICHEVAHVLAGARYGSKSHDPWFARTYLELVSTVMGSEAWQALHAAFTERGIEIDTQNTGRGIAL